MRWKYVVFLVLATLLTLVMALGYPKTGKVSEQPKTFNEVVPIGSQAPGFSLETLDGETISLKSLRGKIVVLVTGARTCPHFLVYINSMDELYKAYLGRDDVKFFYLYTREPLAGAMAGYGWGFRDIKQPETYDERKEYAAILRKEHKIDIPILIGSMDGAVHKAYGNKANSVVIIDREGKIAARDMWNDPLLVELALRDIVENPPMVAQVETMLSCEQCHENRVRTIDEESEYNCASCHSMKKARRGLTNRMDRSHRKISCNSACHNVEEVPEQIGTGSFLRDMRIVGEPPLHEEPGLSFTHMPHINVGRFAYLANFHVVSFGTQLGSCRICHSGRPLMSLKEEQCTECHGADPHKFHHVFSDEMKCMECHTTPGKPPKD